jgi:hypothetical protein
MALNIYASIIMLEPSRRKEALSYFKQSETLSQRIPYWYDSIESIYLPDFQLDWETETDF